MPLTVFNGLEHVRLTRVDYYANHGWFAKREDLAERSVHYPEEHPSGAKVRQFLGMVRKHPHGTPMVVGCSADSLMQVYLADAARFAGVPAFIFTPKRRERSFATRWVMEMGATVSEVTPGYPSVYRKAARDKVKELGDCIRWDVDLAVSDAAAQTINLPEECRRVVIPTGSGLVAAGVLAGLSRYRRLDVEVLCVLPKGGMAKRDRILATAQKLVGAATLPKLTIHLHETRYGKPVFAELPDGTLLDPGYAAKALGSLRALDCLWVTGTRPAFLIRQMQ